VLDLRAGVTSMCPLSRSAAGHNSTPISMSQSVGISLRSELKVISSLVNWFQTAKDRARD